MQENKEELLLLLSAMEKISMVGLNIIVRCWQNV